MVKHIPHALSVAVLGFAVTFLSVHPAVGFILWPTLIGWAAYLLSGAKPVHGLKTLANLIFGGVLSIAIIKLGTYLSAEVGTYAFPIAVACAVFVMWMTPEIRYLNRYINLPVYQILGAATFFGLGYSDDYMNVVNLGSVLLIGMVCGFCDFHARNLVAKYVTHKPSPWPAFRKNTASFAAGEKEKKRAA